MSPTTLRRLRRRAAIKGAVIDKGSIPAGLLFAALGWWILHAIHQQQQRPNPVLLAIAAVPMLAAVAFSVAFFIRLCQKRDIEWAPVLGTLIGLLASPVVLFLGSWLFELVSGFIR